jgi:hypothetical protein
VAVKPTRRAGVATSQRGVVLDGCWALSLNNDRSEIDRYLNTLGRINTFNIVKLDTVHRILIISVSAFALLSNTNAKDTPPHVPLYASKDFGGKASVGEVLKTLKLDENTLIIYAPDNGPWKLNEGKGGSAYPLRGYTFQTLEGGMRVPCLVRWPGKIPSGAECSGVAATIDLLPTIAGLMGTQVPQDRVIDGKDIWPLVAMRS